jgi:hypothetical protein
MSSGRHAFQTCICSLIGFNSYFVLYLMRCFGNNPLYMDFKPITILFCSVCFLCCVIVSVFVCLRSVSVGLNVASVYRSRSQALEFRTPLFFIWSLPRLWYGSLSGSIILNHLSIFYNISCYNSLVLITVVSRSSCRFTYIYKDQMRKKGGGGSGIRVPVI